MPTPIGIDFGTTNSCVAILRGRQPRVVPNAEGQMTTPSVVALLDHDRRAVGAAAKRQSITNPDRTISSVKRFLGRTLAEVESERRAVPFTLTDENGTVRISAGGATFTPEELAALVLRKLRDDVEQYLGEPVGDVVVTVPAYFNDAQRQAVKDAAAIAGLNVVRLLNEPTAAALAYGFDREDRRQAKVIVFDLGGGTFDVSLLDVRGGIFQVKATSGDNHLGGDDFDHAIVEWLLEEARAEHGVELAADPLALQRLYDEAERAKKDLTALPETEINLPFLAAGPDGPVHLQRTLGRAQLEKLVRPLLDRLGEPIRYCLEQAGLDASEIDDVVLVGGMTRSPLVQEEVRKVLGREPHGGVNPDEAIALGAAIQAGALAGDVADVVLLDVTPLSLGVEVKSGLVQRLIAANSPLPAKAAGVFTTADDGQTSVEVRVMQGERELARDNRQLGVLQLAGIDPQPAGTARIEVSFELTGEGLLRALVRDAASGNERQLELRSQTALGSDEVERLRAEADAYAEADREARAAAELRQSLAALAGELGGLLERGVVAGAAAEPLRRVLARIDAGVSGDVDIDALRTLHEELEFAAGEARQALRG